MANTKVLPHKKKISKTYSLERRIVEDLNTVAMERGTSPSVIVNRLIKEYNDKHLER